jgi:hypothetical protein
LYPKNTVIEISNLPERYETLEIEITPYQNWDNIPTAVKTVVRTVNPDRVIVDTRFSYANLRSTDAVVKELILLLKLCGKTNQPPSEVKITIHDLWAFLVLTGQSHVYSNTLKTLVQRFRKELRASNTKVNLELGKSDAFLSFQQYNESLIRESTNIVPTQEQTGETIRKFIEEQSQIRQRLNLWTPNWKTTRSLVESG